MSLINTYIGKNIYGFYSIKDIKNYILKNYSKNGIVSSRKEIIELKGGAFLVWISRNQILKEQKINKFYNLLTFLKLEANKKKKIKTTKKQINITKEVEKKVLETEIKLKSTKLEYINGVISNKKIKDGYISLFAGGGGGSIGLKKSGWKNLVGVDIDLRQSMLYQYNIGKALNYDITKINFNKLKETSGIPKLLLLSPPCQFFSLSNRVINNSNIKELDNKNKEIFKSIYRGVEELNSDFILFENVPNIKNYDFFDQFIKDIENFGYLSKIYELKVSDFGGLTIRKRCIVIFSKKDIFKKLDIFLKNNKKINKVEWTGNSLKGIRNSNKYCLENKKSLLSLKRIKFVIDMMIKHKNYKSPSKELLEKINKINGYKHFNSEFYLIPKNNDFVPTLLARPHLIHPNGKRFLTIEELKKIQGYNYNYDFLDFNHRDATYSIGESISPILTKLLGEFLKNI